MTFHAIPARHLASIALVAVAVSLAACSSSTSTPAPAVSNGDAGGVSGSGSLTGAFGTDPIKPVVAAYWVGQPGDPAESAGGPFVYLFSTAVSCDALSKGDAWAGSLPAGTQALELIVGTTATAKAVTASAHAGADLVEANYFGQSGTESRATAGTVTLTAYDKDVAVDGTVDVTFPAGSAKGTFHATWCPGGHER